MAKIFRRSEIGNGRDGPLPKGPGEGFLHTQSCDRPGCWLIEIELDDVRYNMSDGDLADYERHFQEVPQLPPPQTGQPVVVRIDLPAP